MKLRQSADRRCEKRLPCLESNMAAEPDQLRMNDYCAPAGMRVDKIC